MKSDCDGLNICVSPEIHMLKSNPQCDRIRTWDHWKKKKKTQEGGDPNGFCILIKVPPESALPCFFTTWGYSEKTATYLPENQEAGSYQTPNLPAPWFYLFVIFFWLHLLHAVVPRPRIAPAPQQWQWPVPNLLTHQGTPSTFILDFLVSRTARGKKNVV